MFSSQASMISVKEVAFYQQDEIRNDSTLNFTCPIDPSTYLIISNTTAFNRRKVNELAPEVSSSEDVEALLDVVSWKFLVYSCQLPCKNFVSRRYDFSVFCLSNVTCCFTDSTDGILLYFDQCASTTCTSFTNEFAITKWYTFLILGLLCLLGNFVVIYNKTKSLRKKQNSGKEVQIYNVLVLNLALSDFLMGIHLTAIAFEINFKVAAEIFFSEQKLCNFLGILNALSTQVSTTILLIISFYRLAGVVFPFKNVHIKVVIVLGIITWCTWLGIVVLPIIPIETLKTTFTFGLVKERRLQMDSLIDFLRLTTLFQSILEVNAWASDSEIKSVLQAIIKYPSVPVLKQASEMFGLVNLENDDWSSVGYYDLQYGCALNFFITNEANRLFNYFTLTFVIFNFFASTAMLIAYLLVSCKILEKKMLLNSLCKHCTAGIKQMQKNTDADGSNLTLRRDENKKVFRRLSIILITNLLCWIPFSTAAMVLSYLPNNTGNGELVLTTLLSVQTAMLFVVPLNSILNPYIYSFHLWRRLFTKMKNKVLNDNKIAAIF